MVTIIILVAIALLVGLAWPIMQFVFQNAWGILLLFVAVGAIFCLIDKLWQPADEKALAKKQTERAESKAKSRRIEAERLAKEEAEKAAHKAYVKKHGLTNTTLGLLTAFTLVVMFGTTLCFTSSEQMPLAIQILSATSTIILLCITIHFYLDRARKKSKNKKSPRK